MEELNLGLFIPSTQVWDVSEIYSTDVTSSEFKELLVRLYQNLNNQSIAINLKDTGYYDTREFVNGQSFLPNSALGSSSSTYPSMRQVFRKVINFFTPATPGNLPNAGPITRPHEIPITADYTFTRIYGAASDTTNKVYIPLPYSSPVLVNNIELKIDGTNVTIITGNDRTSFNVCYVIVEYIKQ